VKPSFDPLFASQMPESVCPGCGKPLDAATQASNMPIRPKEGDISLCVRCGDVARYDAELRLRACSDLELAGLVKAGRFAQADLEHLRRLQAAIRRRN
jgi:hypothetical protein